MSVIKTSLLLFLVLILLFVAFLFSQFPHTKTAQAADVSGAMAMFGGRILFSVPCTCSIPPDSELITVGAPSSGDFMYTPGISRAYKNYAPFPGNWILGLASAPDECLIGVPPSCTSAGTGASIVIFGTSE